MVQDQDLIRIRNITLIILAILVVLYTILFFTLPSDMSLAIITSSLLAFIVFIVTLAYYRWIAARKIVKAARSVMISFLVKIIIFGGTFYLLVRLDIVNMMAFTISFIVFFTIFLNVEIFMIYKRFLFK
jgi:hypothetical protein